MSEIANLTYNLVDYIDKNCVIVEGFIVTADGVLWENRDELVTLIPSSGGIAGDFGSLLSPGIQVYTRGKDKAKSKTQSFNIFEKLTRVSGLTLPEVTYDDVIYPEITNVQINAEQVPGYIGADDKGRHEWTFNLTVYLKGGCR